MKTIFFIYCLLLCQLAKSNQAFVSVNKQGSDSFWAKETCAKVAAGLNQTRNHFEVTCNWNQKNNFRPQEVSLARSTGHYSYYLELIEANDGNLNLRIVNWAKKSETDFSQTGWKIKNGSDQDVVVMSLLRKFTLFDKDPNYLKAQLVKDAIGESKEITYDEEKGFVEKLTNQPVASDQAVEIFQGESKRQTNYIRAGIELAVALGLGTFNYYRDSSNDVDTDFHSASESFRNKVVTGKGWSTDTNSIGINEGHAYAGLIYYQICRSNGMSSVESALCVLVTSSIWEMAAEYREKVSINDQILTIVGGSVIGETLTIMSRYMRSKGSTDLKKALGYVFDPIYAVNYGLDKFNNKSFNTPMPAEEFNKDLWGKIEFYTEYEQLVRGKLPSKTGANTKSVVNIGMNGKVINIANYEASGEAKNWTKDTAMAEMYLKYGATNSTMKEFLLLTKVVWVGWHQKSISETGAGGLNGYNWIIGPASGVDFRKSYDGYSTDKSPDFLVNVNVIGAKAYLNIYKNEQKITATVEFFGDYVMVRSFAIDDHFARNGDVGYARILREQNYYYGIGNTSRGELIWEYRGIEMGAWGAYSQAKITNSYYRDQVDITKNMNASDSRGEAAVYASYKLTKDLSLKLNVRRVRRTGEIEGSVEKKSFQTMVGASVNYLF